MASGDLSKICPYQLAIQKDLRGKGKTFRMYQSIDERRRLANYDCYPCNGYNYECDSNPLNAFNN